MSYKVIEYLSGKQVGDTVSSVALARQIAYQALEATGQAFQIVFIETRVIETISPLKPALSGVDFDKLPRPVNGKMPRNEPPYDSRGGGHHVWSTPAGKGDRDGE